VDFGALVLIVSSVSVSASGSSAVASSVVVVMVVPAVVVVIDSVVAAVVMASVAPSSFAPASKSTAPPEPFETGTVTTRDRSSCCALVAFDVGGVSSVLSYAFGRSTTLAPSTVVSGDFVSFAVIFTSASSVFFSMVVLVSRRVRWLKSSAVATPHRCGCDCIDDDDDDSKADTAIQTARLDIIRTTDADVRLDRRCDGLGMVALRMRGTCRGD